MESIITLVAFGVVWLIQINFLVFVFFKLLFFKWVSDGQLLPISVVVAVRNDFENITKLVDALVDQTHPHYEIIVVDDRSEFDTYLAMKNRFEGLAKIRLLRVEECPSHIHPKKYAITLGIKAAKHQHILLTDADCLPQSSRWVESLSRSFDQATDFVLGYSAQAKTKGFLNSFIRYETFVTGVQYLSLALAGMPYMGVGRNLAYRKQIFIDNNGFGRFQAVVGGDDDLFVNRYARAKTTKIVLDIESQTVTIPKNTFKEFFIQKKRHLSVGRHYRFGHKFVLSLLNFSHIMMLPCALLVVLFSSFAWVGVIGFFLWILLRHLIFFQLKKRFKESIDMSLFLIHELIFSVYLFLVGIIALTAKTVRWK